MVSAFYNTRMLYSTALQIMINLGGGGVFGHNCSLL